MTDLGNEEALVRSAAGQEPMPEGLSLAEQLAWQALAHLYARARLGKVTKEAGTREKREILHAMRVRRQNDEHQTRLAFWHARLRREIELAQAAYCLDRTLKNADKLSDVLHGWMRKGETVDKAGDSRQAAGAE